MNPKRLYQWVKRNSKQWGGTRHFQANVVLFSQGVARTSSSQVRRIAGSVGLRPDSARRRLQRFLSNHIDWAGFVTGWTRSVLAQIKPKVAVLIVDETKLRDRLGVMVVGIAYHERCIPLAWRVYRANDAEGYPSEGQVKMILALLKQVQAGIPARLPVRVLADRGIGTSPDLMRDIMAMHWTFLFRVTKMSKIVLPDGQAVTFYDQVTAPGQTYQAEGEVFKKRGRVPAHVRVFWHPEAQEPCALVTNDPSLSGYEYASRMWIEEAFRDLKSHGWQVEAAALICPQRMARLWILLVVAYAWLLFWGHAAEAAGRSVPLKRRSDGSLVRRWSLFREGQQAFLAAGP